MRDWVDATFKDVKESGKIELTSILLTHEQMPGTVNVNLVFPITLFHYSMSQLDYCILRWLIHSNTFKMEKNVQILELNMKLCRFQNIWCQSSLQSNCQKWNKSGLFLRTVKRTSLSLKKQLCLQRLRSDFLTWQNRSKEEVQGHDSIIFVED